MTVTTGTRCIACGAGESCRLLGPLKDAVGVVALDHPGSLYACRNCGLFFRHPFPAEQQLAARYAHVSTTHWCNDSRPRPDFLLIRRLVTRFLPEGAILDIGCSSGDFLAGLPEHYLKYGIEPSEKARSQAAGRGISVLGGEMKDVSTGQPVADVITAIDVLEHIPQPVAFIEQAKGMLRPGGDTDILHGQCRFMAVAAASAGLLVLPFGARCVFWPPVV